MNSALLEVDLSASYAHRPGALDGVRFSVAPGEIFGVAGPSGSGKSTLALALLGLLPLRGGAVRGSVVFDGLQLVGAKERQWRALRGRQIAFVPQSAVSALNPALTLDSHFREAWRAHSGEPWPRVRPFVRDSLASLGLPAEESFLARYPHQVSVGQAQRLLIAMAVLHRPRLLIADEPTSALDPASQAGILDLFRRLRDENGVAAVYISHDLPSLVSLAGRAGVLVAGRMDRIGPAADLLAPCPAPGFGPDFEPALSAGPARGGLR